MINYKEQAEHIINTHPSYVRLKAQLVKGLEKYGEPVTSESYSIYGWFEHKQMELTDELVYNEMIQVKLKMIGHLLHTATHQDDIEEMRRYLLHALETLEGHKEGNE